MKRYILAIVCCVMAIMTYAECTTLTGSPVMVSRWGNDYQPVQDEMDCWELDLGATGYVKIVYHIDLEIMQSYDQVTIYEIYESNRVRLVSNFSAGSFSDTIFIKSTTGKFKVVYWGLIGNCGGLYNGFKINFEIMPNCEMVCGIVNQDLFVLGNLGVGTTSPTHELDVRGTIRANEIVVNTTGADFVFADDYQLRPLSEVKTFIQENKHLPEIKSAQEMQENGVGINELQTQLLQKIEELTLYILQQEERIRLQEERIEALEKK